MRKTTLLFLAVLVGGIAVLFWLGEMKKHSRKSTNVSTADSQSQSIAPTISQPTNEASQTNMVFMVQSTNDAYLLSLSVRDFYAQTRIDHQLEWKMPISFYGRVIDENGATIAGANVHFKWTDISPTGTSEADVKSDSNGFFSLESRRGKYLFITVDKEGYYSSGNSKGSGFEYAQPDIRFKPDPNNPVVFHLRKKGVGEPLIVLQKGFLISRNGAPVEVDLKTGRTTSSADSVKVECLVKDGEKNQSGHFDWTCKISVPNGGLIESTDEFPFQAPLEGYQPISEIDMPSSLEQGWKSDVTTNYVLRFNDGNYAYLKFRMIAGGDNFFKLESFLNPAGSRNLEPDPLKEIKAGQ